ncbi:MAG: fibronectin type III domain-containing protein [Desulfobaccales bacterium]
MGPRFMHNLKKILGGKEALLSNEWPHSPPQTQPRRRWSPFSRLPALLLVISVLTIVLACGKKEWPLSPDLLAPAAVRNFHLAQNGESLVLSWDFPRENQVGQPLTQLEGFRLYRAASSGISPDKSCPPDFVLLADIDLAYPKVGRVAGEGVVYEDRTLEPGKCYSYRVAAYGRRGAVGPWSPVLSHAWDILPQAPGGLRIEAGDREVQLSWAPVTALRNGAPLREPAGYLVYRKSDREDWRRLTPTPLEAAGYHDVAVANEVEYTYTVRTLRRLGDYYLESLDSPSRTATPQDLTPPPPPLNLVAVPTSRGVELRWDPSPVPDLAGYRVYRRGDRKATPVRLLPDLVKQPYFVDTQAVPGQAYFYAVTAVDDSKRRNESLPSEEAPVILRPLRKGP